MSRRTVVGFIVVVAALSVVGATVFVVALSRSGTTTPTTAMGAPHFVDETAAAGIAQTYKGDSQYSVGGGVAVFDCNGDGKPDIYMAGGSDPAALYRDDSLVGGALKFTKLQDPATDLTNVEGAYPIDIDGDGKVDLAVLRFGETILLRGMGDCRFQRANEAWSFDGGNAYTAAFSATWEGSSVLPTLAIGNYLKIDPSASRATLDCADSRVVRPKADGTGFGPPIALTPGYCTLSMLFSDWDRSGRRDLRMTNDRNYYVNGSDQLWRVAPGEQPRPYTDADGWVSMQIFGMGIASYDLTGDGYPEVFLSSQADNRLQTLTSGPGQPTYRDIAQKRGVLAAQPFTGGDVLPSTAWHSEFQDVNNDGFIDLFVAKGNVNAEANFAQKDPNNLFLGQPDGTFKEASDVAGVLNYARGRGAALADFNLDGMLDLVEVNYLDGAKLWRNVGSGDAAKPGQMGNWIAIRPTETGPNRDAIGAWIEIQVGDKTMRRELTVGGGHAGGQLGWTHFGLGSAGDARVRVQWPDGEVGPWMQVTANQFVDIARGSAEARPWAPPNR